MNHLVQFRYGTLVLYGEVIHEDYDEEENRVYTVMAGNHIYREIRREDMVRDYGLDLD